jgi:hypothetical protein
MSDYPRARVKTEIGELEIRVYSAESIGLNTPESYEGGNRSESYICINRVEYRLSFRYKLDAKTGTFVRESYDLYRKGCYSSNSWTWAALKKAQAVSDALVNTWAKEHPEALGSGERTRLAGEIERAEEKLKEHDETRVGLVQELESLKAKLKATPKSIQVNPPETATNPDAFTFITKDIKPVLVPKVPDQEAAK